MSKFKVRVEVCTSETFGGERADVADMHFVSATRVFQHFLLGKLVDMFNIMLLRLPT